MSESDPPGRDPPYLFECMFCEHRRSAEGGPVACPRCGEEMKNVSMPSEDGGLAGPSY